MHTWITSLAIAYVLGSIPFGYILVRLFRNQDVRATGSGNIGATNVARSGGKGLGIATLVLDLAKGYVAVAIAEHLAANAAAINPSAFPHPFDVAVIAGCVVTAAHIFPIWLGFRGGKGVATAEGAFLALAPWAGAALLLIFAIIFAITRLVSLGSIIAAASYPPIAIYTVHHDRTPILIAGFVFIPLIVIIKHHSNIGRILRGAEPRFGAKKSAA